jgi:hypothetical protein
MSRNKRPRKGDADVPLRAPPFVRSVEQTNSQREEQEHARVARSSQARLLALADCLLGNKPVGGMQMSKQPQKPIKDDFPNDNERVPLHERNRRKEDRRIIEKRKPPKKKRT